MGMPKYYLILANANHPINPWTIPADNSVPLFILNHPKRRPDPNLKIRLKNSSPIDPNGAIPRCAIEKINACNRLPTQEPYRLPSSPCRNPLKIVSSWKAAIPNVLSIEKPTQHQVDRDLSKRLS
jgi:hypothetical protein